MIKVIKVEIYEDFEGMRNCEIFKNEENAKEWIKKETNNIGYWESDYEFVSGVMTYRIIGIKI